MGAQGRRAIVTGASRGLGRAVATHLARAGWDLVLCARDMEALSRVARELTNSSPIDVAAIPFDLASPQEADRVARELGEMGDLRALVHCASFTPDPVAHAALLDTHPSDTREMIDTMIGGTTIMVRMMLSLLGERGGGDMLIVGSDWALRGSHGPPVFSAAKAYMLQLARGIRREAAAKSIRVTTIIPGDIATYDADWSDPKWTLDDDLEAVRAELGYSRIPLLDICETVSFCLERKMMRVEEIICAPLDPTYEP